jgi:hypothetical protein
MSLRDRFTLWRMERLLANKCHECGKHKWLWHYLFRSEADEKWVWISWRDGHGFEPCWVA